MLSVTRSASLARGAEHREQRRNHQHQQQHERRDRRQRLTATKPAEQPLIHRVAQAREDGRQQDRQQEHADHGDERDRDRGDQQKQKGLAEARLCHGEAGAAGNGRDQLERELYDPLPASTTSLGSRAR